MMGHGGAVSIPMHRDEIIRGFEISRGNYVRLG